MRASPVPAFTVPGPDWSHGASPRGPGLTACPAGRISPAARPRRRRAYGVDASFALFLRHGGGIHAVSAAGRPGAGTQLEPRQPQDHPGTLGSPARNEPPGRQGRNPRRKRSLVNSVDDHGRVGGIRARSAGGLLGGMDRLGQQLLAVAALPPSPSRHRARPSRTVSAYPNKPERAPFITAPSSGPRQAPNPSPRPGPPCIPVRYALRSAVHSGPPCGKRLPDSYTNTLRLPDGSSQGPVAPLLRERDMSRIAGAGGGSRGPAGHCTALARLTRRSSATSPGNVARTRYRPRNNREIRPKPAHGTHALQEYGAAGAEPPPTLDPEGPNAPWRHSESISPLA